MSDIDDLLAELTQSRPDPASPGHTSVPPEKATGHGGRPLILWLAAGLALLAVAVGGLVALGAGSGDSATDAAGDERSVPLGASTSARSASGQPGDAGPVATIGSAPVATTPASAGEGVPAPTTTTPGENPQGAVRYVTVSGGQVTVRGEAPTRAVGDALVASVTAAAGGPVVDQLAIVPTAPADTAVAVYLPDRLLFDFNSIEVGAADLWQLDVAARLLAAFPELTVRVVARTDATGSDDLNLRVADLRATAVCNYLLSIGASPSQIELDPVGEADEPHDEADDHDAAADRHVELVVEGTLRG
ncbi:MAG: OmpA family protein [Acidimicrobiales bacterium]